MADRKLIVEVVGDDRGLQATLNKSVAAVTRFASQVERIDTRAATPRDKLFEKYGFTESIKKARGMSAEIDRLNTESERLEASAAGADRSMGALVARSVGVGFALTAAYQASRQLSDALQTSGEEAFTTAGRLRNLGASLLSGDIVGGIRALSALPKTLDEAGISAVEAANKYQTFRALVDFDGPVSKLAQQAVDLVDATRNAAAAQDALADAVLRVGQAFRTSTGEAVRFQGAVDDRGGLRGPGLVDEINTALAAARGAGSSARLPRDIGPTARNENRLILAAANEDLQEVLRLQRIERDRLAAAVQNATGNRDQRIQLNREFAQAKAAVVGTEKTIKSMAAADAKAAAEARKAAAAAAKAAAEAAKAARSDLWRKVIQSLTLNVSRAELTAPLADDLKRLVDLKQGLLRQVRAGVDVQEAQSQIVSVESAIAAKQEEIQAQRVRLAEAARKRLAGNQFRRLGLSSTGEEIIPGIKNLQTRIDGALRRISSGDEDVSTKLVDRLKLARKLLREEGKRMLPEVRSTINDLVKAVTGEFDKLEGPLTPTTSLNANKVLEGLALGRDLEKELRARLSSFNSAGLSLAGAKAPTGGFRGGVVVVEANTTVQLDQDVVGRAVTRSQQKTGRRNSKQKRGPNSGI